MANTGFYTKLNVWGSQGLNFDYDGGPIIENGGPIFLYKRRNLGDSTSFREVARGWFLVRFCISFAKKVSQIALFRSGLKAPAEPSRRLAESNFYFFKNILRGDIS